MFDIDPNPLGLLLTAAVLIAVRLGSYVAYRRRVTARLRWVAS